MNDHQVSRCGDLYRGQGVKGSRIRVAGDLGYIAEGELGTAKRDIAEIERMLKALIRSVENKHLHLFKAKAAIVDPWYPWTLFSN